MVVATSYLLYIFTLKANTIDFIESLKPLKHKPGNVLLVLLLMPLNWFIEIVKWRYSQAKIQKISLTQSAESISLGIIIGSFTPNRIGEMGGRLLHINKKNRVNSLYLSSISSISQLTVTILFGLVSLVSLHTQLGTNDYVPTSILIATMSFAVTIVLGIYFNSTLINKGVNFFYSKLKSTPINELIGLNSTERLQLLLLSFIRYLIFCVQFSILIFSIIPEASLLDLFWASALIFFATTLVPTAWLSTLPVRTSFAFVVIELLGYNGIYGLTASILLWVINLFIPSVIGLLLMNKVIIKALKLKRK